MKHPVPNAIPYDTKPATNKTNYWLVQIKCSTILDCLMASIIVNSIGGSGGTIWNPAEERNTVKTYVMWRFSGRISIGTFPIEDMLWPVCDFCDLIKGQIIGNMRVYHVF